MEHNPMEASNIVQSQFSSYLKHGLTTLCPLKPQSLCCGAVPVFAWYLLEVK